MGTSPPHLFINLGGVRENLFPLYPSSSLVDNGSARTRYSLVVDPVRVLLMITIGPLPAELGRLTRLADLHVVEGCKSYSLPLRRGFTRYGKMNMMFFCMMQPYLQEMNNTLGSTTINIIDPGNGSIDCQTRARGGTGGASC